MATEMEGKGVDLAETPWKWRHMRIVLKTNVANFPVLFPKELEEEDQNNNTFISLLDLFTVFALSNSMNWYAYDAMSQLLCEDRLWHNNYV